MPLTATTEEAGVHAPLSSYAHAVLTQGPGTRIVVSGQVGILEDGSVPPDGAAQMDAALGNLGRILANHGCGPQDIVKMTVFLTDPALVGAWRTARDNFSGGHLHASTLLIVAGLASPKFLIEVEAEAFLAD